MITYKIHLIRTGSTSVHPGKRYVGQSNIPLCERGVKALEDLREEFRYPKVQVVYTSPLWRCQQTADILYPEVETRIAQGFQDMNLGEFEGKTFDELRDNPDFSSWMANSFENTPPGGEETAAFTRRVVEALDTLFHEMVKERLTSVAVVTHGGVIMTLLAAVGLPKLPLHQWAVDNGTGYTVLMSTQMWMRDRVGEVFTFIPDPPIQDDMELYDMYFNG